MNRWRMMALAALMLALFAFLALEGEAALSYVESRLATTAIPTTTPVRRLPPTVPPPPTPTLTPVPTATPLPSPTPTPTPIPPTEPTRLRIPSIGLDAPVEAVHWALEETAGGTQWVWQVPNHRAVGWHDTSACLGAKGNTVLNGHNYGYGEVFRDLYKVQVGDVISVTGANGLVYPYRVEERYLLEEGNQPLGVRQQNASFVAETDDERLTLVTCHPYGSTRYRLIVVARPAGPPVP